MPLSILNAAAEGFKIGKTAVSLTYSDKTQQYLSAELRTGTEISYYAGGIYATFKPPLIHWLRNNLHRNLKLRWLEQCGILTPDWLNTEIFQTTTC